MTIELAPTAERTIQRYYDSHPTEKDLMGQSLSQSRAATYLNDVLNYQYRRENYLIAVDYNLYYTDTPREKPVIPDVMVFKSVRADAVPGSRDRSWTVKLPECHGPEVVFEFISQDSIERDLITKPETYENFGVQEYFCLDARLEEERRRHRVRIPVLSGWTYPGHLPIAADDRGWLWSEVLESWLAPDGPVVRLYDRYGHLRPTGEEAERQVSEAERERAGAERGRAEAERGRAEAAERKAEAEHSALGKLRTQLRAAGIDPDHPG